MNEPRVERAQPDLLTKLEHDVLDRAISLADVLRTCLMLAGWTHAVQLREWVTAELRGYPSIEVPDYRKVRAPIMQVVQTTYDRFTSHLFDVNSVPDEIREYFTEIVPLNQGVDALEALVAESEAQQRQIQLDHYASSAYMRIRNSSNRSYSITALYWSIPPAVVRGVLGEIRTVLTEFVAGLRFEADGNDQLPSAELTDNTLRAVVGSAIFNNSTVNLFTGNSRTGDIVNGQTHNKYSFGGVKGNVAAGSSNFNQLYNDSFDVTKVQDFVDLITEIAGTLELAPDQRAELEAGADELRAAVNNQAADRGRTRRALDAVMSSLKLAGATAVRNAAITLGTQIGGELDAAIHHLPYP